MLLFGAFVGGGIGATISYLTAGGDEENNSFNAGNVTIDIIEEFEAPAELTVGENTFVKNVSFKNSGTVSAYVRARCAFSDNDVEKISEISTDNGTSWFAASKLSENLPEKWIYIGTSDLEGYFYYFEPLQPGESTTSLFTNIRTVFAEKISDADISVNYTPRDFDIFIYAEGLQQMMLDGSGENTSYDQAWEEFLALKGE